nr:MAG TPA: hypothetical protein [Caudoviricetes sp.]
MPRDLPEKNTAHRLFGNSAGYSTNGVVVCVLPQKSKGENAMEYNYYLRQTYRSDGSVWVCIHEAATAEKLGYQDGDKYVQDDCTIFINGFDSLHALNIFIENLYNCVNRMAEAAALYKEDC